MYSEKPSVSVEISGYRLPHPIVGLYLIHESTLSVIVGSFPAVHLGSKVALSAGSCRQPYFESSLALRIAQWR